MTDRELLDSIAKGMTEIKGRLGNVENGLSNVESRFDNLEGRLDNVDNRFDNLEGRLDNVDNRLNNVESQLSETNQIVKALMHRTEELDAKYDNLLNVTATRDSVVRLEIKIDKILATQITQGESINILAIRQLQVEADIAALKKAE